MTSAKPRISVVLPTYQRPDECKRAVASALYQDPVPLEVLVCDDGSADRTQPEFEAWARDEPRLRYLRLPRNFGGPAAARNLGIDGARGEWIAFLDDDDLWLPGKLRVQSEIIDGGAYDVIASDARRTSGGPYFGLDAPSEPDRAEFLRHNPIVTSTAVVRRSTLLAVGGFIRSAMGLAITGVEDYAIWLTLAYRGARFLVLPDRLVTYDDEETARVSRAVARQEAEVAAIRWRLWLRRPHDVAVLAAAMRGTADAVRWWRRGSAAAAGP
jgi:teichuronic acid biosynthesis glycosyltransferase TuaG